MRFALILFCFVLSMQFVHADKRKSIWSKFEEAFSKTFKAVSDDISKDYHKTKENVQELIEFPKKDWQRAKKELKVATKREVAQFHEDTHRTIRHVRDIPTWLRKEFDFKPIKMSMAQVRKTFFEDLSQTKANFNAIPRLLHEEWLYSTRNLQIVGQNFITILREDAEKTLYNFQSVPEFVREDFEESLRNLKKGFHQLQLDFSEDVSNTKRNFRTLPEEMVHHFQESATNIRYIGESFVEELEKDYKKTGQNLVTVKNLLVDDFLSNSKKTKENALYFFDEVYNTPHQFKLVFQLAWEDILKQLKEDIENTKNDLHEISHEFY